jgi:HEAT repeat protein
MSAHSGPDTMRAGEHQARAKRVGIFTTDADLVVKSWDATLEQMTGIAADRARGRRLLDLVPDLQARGLADLLREPLVSGAAQVLAPALHKFLIPCPPLEPSLEFDRMQQRVVVGALRDERHAVGLVVAIEDVTVRLERERALARQLRDSDPAVRLAAIERLAPFESANGVGALGEAIGDDDWRVRRSAVRALAARRDASLVEAVVTALREGHRDFSLLSSALGLLALTGVDLTTALIGLLSDPDADLRLQAALALGSQRGPAAVSALIAALNDPDTNVRFHAIEALGKLGALEARDPLVAVAESRDFFLAFAALDALARINDPSIAVRLTPLLDDPALAAQTAEVLGQIGDEFSVQSLVEALQNLEHAPVTAIATAIANIHQRHKDLFGDATEIEDLVARKITPAGAERVLQALPRANGRDLRGLVVILGWTEGEAVQRALAHLVGTTGVHKDVIEALVRFGSPAVDVLIEQLSPDDVETTRAAVVALGRIADRRAVPALIALLDDDHRDLWVAVAGALSRIGDGRAFEPLLSLIGDDDAAVRQASIGALNSIGHPAMAARIHGLLGDDNPHVRESAVRIAGYFGYTSCVDDVIARCQDEHESVRAAALEHLPFLEDSRVFDTLRRALTSDTPRARAAAAHALGGVVAAEASAQLQKAATDHDTWVRYFSAISIGRRRDVSLLPLLERLATSDPARHVRVAAIEAVGAIGNAGGEEALRILTPFATADEDDLANAAVRALGRLRSADALAPLSQAMRASDPRRRAIAAEALTTTDHPGAVDLLRWTASADGDPDVARAAMAALSTLASGDGPSRRGAVEALAATTAEASRQNEAVRALARIPASALPWLAEHLAADQPDVRRAVVEALGRMSHPVASAYLQRAMEDGDPIVRRRAVTALLRLGTRGLSRRLTIMARTDPSEAVREAATAALARQESGDDPRSDAAQ